MKRDESLSFKRTELVVPVAKLLSEAGAELPDTLPPVRTAPAPRRYLAIGMEHILLGVDHLLFVLGLLLVRVRVRQLAALVTTFTLGHSVTLVAASLNWVSVNVPLVETLIALSIVYLASANLWTLRAPRDAAVTAPPLRGRLALVFGFGLVHGLGFSAALSQIGLSYESRLLSLLYFNLGVEIGQLAVVLTLVPIVLLAWRRLSYRGVSMTLSLTIGLSGGFWAAERAGLLSV